MVLTMTDAGTILPELYTEPPGSSALPTGTTPDPQSLSSRLRCTSQRCRNDQKPSPFSVQRCLCCPTHVATVSPQRSTTFSSVCLPGSWIVMVLVLTGCVVFGVVGFGAVGSGAAGSGAVLAGCRPRSSTALCCPGCRPQPGLLCRRSGIPLHLCHHLCRSRRLSRATKITVTTQSYYTQKGITLQFP